MARNQVNRIGKLPNVGVFLLADSSDSDSEDEYMYRERREYKMSERVDLSRYDEKDHFDRYRFSKRVTMHLVNLISCRLPFDEHR